MSTNQRGFQVVRRGYDIDEVDAFLVRQAEAWGEALEESKAHVRALEEEVVGLKSAAAERERTEHERAVQLESAEVAARQAREDAQREAADIVRTAQTEAAALSQEAEQARQARHAAELEKFEALQAELDVRHQDARERYAKAESILKAKVEDLDATRQSLVAGLEAIARGGLSGLNAEANQALAAVGLAEPAPGVEAEASTGNEAAESDDSALEIAEAAAGVSSPPADDPAPATDAVEAADDPAPATDAADDPVAEATATEQVPGEDAPKTDGAPTNDALAAPHGADEEQPADTSGVNGATGAIEMPPAEADLPTEPDAGGETDADGGGSAPDGAKTPFSDATETIDLTAAAPVSTFVNGNGHSNN